MCAIVCDGLSLIETCLCAQALWVDVGSGLGRSPPSSYPSREHSVAKPNLGFTAFHKPSNGTGQRASKDGEGETKTQTVRERERVKIKNIILVWYNRVVCLCFLSCCCLRIQKMGFSPFRGSFVLIYMH